MIEYLNVPANNIKHGQRSTRLYKTWMSMKQRCNNPSSTRFENYGGRGISYVKEWETFLPFYVWAIQNGYNETLQLDRVDNQGNYGPDNCRWVTASQNSRNRRTSRYETLWGETKTLAAWAEDIRCVASSELRKRLYRGWTFEDAMTVPKRGFK